MFLKIVLDTMTKKIKFKENHRNVLELRSLAESIFSLQGKIFDLTFIDAEGETISIVDQIDMEYFLESNANQKFPTVVIRLNDSYSDEEFQEITTEPIKFVQNIVNLSTEDCREQLSQIEVVSQADAATDRKEHADIGTGTSEPVMTDSIQQVDPAITEEAPVSQIPPYAIISMDPIELRILSLENQMKGVIAEFNELKSVQPEEKKVTAVHTLVTCDSCRISQFSGKRFKCLVCEDFDLCETCEAKNDHPHPMIRLMENFNSFCLNKMQKRFKKLTDRMKKIESRHPKDFFTQKLKQAGNLFQKLGELRKPQPCPQMQSQPSKTSEEKKQILKFMFSSLDSQAMEDLIRRYEHLDLLEFCQEISKHT